MHSIQVIRPGLYDTIQDLGRFGMMSLGVPLSGVLDTYSAKLANALLRNNVNCPVLEMTQTGPVLLFQKNATVAITGADMNPKLNDKPVKMQTKLLVKIGDVLIFGKANFGCRSYLAVKNGFKTCLKLNSYSYFKGITPKSKLSKGQILRIGKQFSVANNTHAHIKTDYKHFDTDLIKVFKGPEFNLLTPKQQDFILGNMFTITKNNRMGYQFKTDSNLKNKIEILTSSVMPGTVQLTQSGKLIALMNDCQTTGGYPRVLQLTDEAISVLAQKNTSQKIKFKVIHL